jgi:hypothetical protein
MIHFYGLSQGAFDALFLSGSMAVAFWFIHHIIPDISLAFYLRKKGIKILKLRSFITSVLAPAGAVILFVYSFYEGYSSLTEPYFGGLLFVLVSMVVVAIYVAVKHARNTLGMSYVERTISEEKLRAEFKD